MLKTTNYIVLGGIMEDNRSLEELLRSINNSIQDIQEHPNETTRIPSNMEIIIKGAMDNRAIDFLFSDKMDNIIKMLFACIETGNFDRILNNEQELQNLLDACFGKGSFQGPVSQTIITSVQASVQSRKYNEIKSYLGKTATALKKIKLVMKNLKKDAKRFPKKSEEYKKCKEAIYAIKQVLKFTARVYHNRKLINRKVFDGLNNIVHEDIEFEERLY